MTLQQGAEDILTPEGVMEVWLLEAQEVPKMDFFGSGQPYGKYVSATEGPPLPFPPYIGLGQREAQV